MAYWLLKTEPGTFSLDDLRRAPGGVAPWDGVRNYQARNHMRDGMRLGDGVLIYHSSTERRAIVGQARVARTAYPDHTAWDPASDHHDPRSTPENPVWWMVDVAFEEQFPRPLLLGELHGVSELAGMLLLRRGMRLSVQPVSPEHFRAVLAYGRGEKPMPVLEERGPPPKRRASAKRKAPPVPRKPVARKKARKKARKPVASARGGPPARDKPPRAKASGRSAR